MISLWYTWLVNEVDNINQKINAIIRSREFGPVKVYCWHCLPVQSDCTLFASGAVISFQLPDADLDKDFLDCVDQLFAAMFSPEDGSELNLKSGSALMNSFQVWTTSWIYQLFAVPSFHWMVGPTKLRHHYSLSMTVVILEAGGWHFIFRVIYCILGTWIVLFHRDMTF